MNTARCFLVQCPSLCRRFYYVHAKRALEMKRRTRLVVRNFIPGWFPSVRTRREERLSTKIPEENRGEAGRGAARGRCSTIIRRERWNWVNKVSARITNWVTLLRTLPHDVRSIGRFTGFIYAPFLESNKTQRDGRTTRIFRAPATILSSTRDSRHQRKKKQKNVNSVIRLAPSK